MVDKNYDKSFDHRSFYFRQQDKRVFTAKVIAMMIPLSVLLFPSFRSSPFPQNTLSLHCPLYPYSILPFS